MHTLRGLWQHHCRKPCFFFCHLCGRRTFFVFLSQWQTEADLKTLRLSLGVVLMRNQATQMREVFWWIHQPIHAWGKNSRFCHFPKLQRSETMLLRMTHQHLQTAWVREHDTGAMLIIKWEDRSVLVQTIWGESSERKLFLMESWPLF